MKILQICDYYQHLGGAEQYMLSLSEDLETLGHKVSVFYGIKTKNTLHSNKRGEFFLPALMNEAPLDKETENTFNKILKRENPDIIFVHNVANSSIVHYFTLHKPVVRYIHDFSLTCLNWRKTLPSQDKICTHSLGFRCLQNAYTNRCFSRNPKTALKKLKFNRQQLEIHNSLDKLIVASGYMKANLIQNGLSPEKIKVIPYYTEPMSYSQVNFENYILFVGRIHETKGLQYLLQALEDCPDKLRLVVVGEGGYQEKINNLISKKNLNFRVDFKGWLSQEQLREYYLNCLALVVPSIWPEPFGIVGIEAMSYKKPVVAFDVGGISAWLEDGVTGFLVERKNIEVLAEKINFLLTNPKDAKKMGAVGEETYKKKFTKERHLANLVECFEELKK